MDILTCNKQGRQSVIVDRIGYDKEGHTVYTKLGNGTEAAYTYDKQRERLQVMNLTADGQTVMENRYRYDAVDNVLGITNAAEKIWKNLSGNDEHHDLIRRSPKLPGSKLYYKTVSELIGQNKKLKSIFNDASKYYKKHY